MKLKRDAKTLKSKSIASLTRGLNIFNNSEENGRHETVLLLLQHSSEMLLKSLLIQKGENVFDKQRGISIGLNKALQTALNKSWITEGQAGAIRTLDAMRDQAQHWMLVSSEELLYINSRALITAIDEILTKHFDDTLADNLPLRVLPISTAPMTDINILLDKEFTQIKELLSPNRRARDEARGRIAALLAMEAHSGQEVQISKKDIDRIEKAIREGAKLDTIFPKLTPLSATITGEGPTIKIQIKKNDQTLPGVRFIPSDSQEHAAAVREVDLQNKFHLSPTELAKKLNLNINDSKALRDYLDVDKNPSLCHVFTFGSQKHPRFSDNAVKIMTESIHELDNERRAKQRIKKK